MTYEYKRAVSYGKNVFTKSTEQKYKTRIKKIQNTQRTEFKIKRHSNHRRPTICKTFAIRFPFMRFFFVDANAHTYPEIGSVLTVERFDCGAQWVLTRSATRCVKLVNLFAFLLTHRRFFHSAVAKLKRSRFEKSHSSRILWFLFCAFKARFYFGFVFY